MESICSKTSASRAANDDTSRMESQPSRSAARRSLMATSARLRSPEATSSTSTVTPRPCGSRSVCVDVDSGVPGVGAGAVEWPLYPSTRSPLQRRRTGGGLPQPGGRTVTAPTFRAAVHGAVVVIMAQVPRFTGLDAPPTPPAVHRAGRHLGCPSCTELAVLASVPAVCGAALSCHRDASRSP